MNKSQKIWPWVFVVMFIVPEILFSFVTSWIPGVTQLSDNHFFYERFINPQFFIDNPFYLFLALSIECLGMLGLLVWNVKFNHSRYKIVLTVITAVILAFLLFVFYVGYAVSHISF